jgi:tetratricopeptide (TPR) repeat protein/CHAT domain-containing protein
MHKLRFLVQPILVALIVGGGGTHLRSEESGPLKSSLLNLPCKVEKTAGNAGEEYLNFALQAVFGDMLAVHDGLDQQELTWRLTQVFPTKADLETWLSSDVDVPPKAYDLHRRLILTGKIRRDGQNPWVKLLLLDTTSGRRFEAELQIDLPGLVSLRTGLLDLLAQARAAISEAERSKLLWRENIEPKAFVLLGQGVYHTLATFFYDDKENGVDSLQQALAISPDSYELWNTLGWAELAQKNYSSAAEAFKRALELNDAGSHAVDGMIFCAEAQDDDALGAIWTERKAAIHHLPVKPLLAAYWHVRGKAAYQRKDFQTAIAACRKAVELDAGNASYLTDLGYALGQVRDFVGAKAVLQQALEIQRNALGNEHLDTATCMEDLAWVCVQLYEYAKAEPFYREALRIRKKLLGAEHPLVAATLERVASLYRTMGSYTEAETLYQEALRIRKKVLGAEVPEVANSLNDLAVLYVDMCKYAKAEPLYQEALQIETKRFGAEHPDVATFLNNLAFLYDRMGNYAKAEPIYQEAVRIRKKVLGPEHPAVAATLDNLATLYDHMCNYAKAEPLYDEALRIRRKVLGAETPEVAGSLNDLATLYVDMGKYTEAEPLYQEALRIRKKVQGAEDLTVASTLSNLAVLYEYIGNYSEAVTLLQEALRIYKKVLGPEHQSVSIALNNLAAVSVDTGDYANAEALYKEAVRIEKKVLGPEHLDVAASLNNLALLYERMGNYPEAEPLYHEALRIRQNALPPEHPFIAASLNNLAGLYYATGNYVQAEPLYKEALRIQEKVLGPEHPNVAVSMNNLALLYDKIGDYAQAEPLYVEALRIERKVLAPERREVARSLNNLALFYVETGKYAEAEPLYKESVRINKKLLGDDHPDTILCLGNLASLDLDLGRSDEVKSLASSIVASQSRFFAKILSFASEQQRLAYRNKIDFFSLLAATPGNDQELALAVLRYKGIVLDSLVEDQAFYRANRFVAGGENLLAKRAADQQQIGKLLLQSSQLTVEATAKLEALQQEVQAIESKLATSFAAAGQTRRSLGVTSDDILSILPQDGALVEYFVYGRYLGRARWKPSYGAILFLPGTEPKFVALPAIDTLSPVIKRYRHLLAESHAGDDQALKTVLTNLYQQLWEPIQKFLPAAVSRVLISPDGQLNFVSFGTLLESGQTFLAEKLVVEYVTAGRDLVESVQPASATDAVIVANPDFKGLPLPPDSTPDDVAKVRGRETEDLEDLYFDSLSGTASEVSQLEGLLKDWQWKVSILGGAAATKAALLEIHHPGILHIATHGFFAPIESKAEQSGALRIEEGRDKYFENPMHRSGLALAGANLTVAAWRENKEVSAENDGILTAEDAGTLDLQGTWLVTLSACDTGEGEANAGEGVMGLRRGFLEAGAQNLLMTLWPISDESTVELMKDFYIKAHESKNAPAALAEVQRHWLVRLRAEKGLAEAVRLAGPFVVSFRGKP